MDNIRANMAETLANNGIEAIVILTQLAAIFDVNLCDILVFAPQNGTR